jgi:ATP-dependent Clp protease ATP-binding subunit ClpC
VDLQMKEIAARLKEHQIEIELTESAREWLAKEGFDPQFGARPLRRMLQRKVESPLSRKLLTGEFKSGDFIFVDAEEKEGILFRKRENAAAEQGVAMEIPAPVAVEG